jgi:hypothetical protein
LFWEKTKEADDNSHGDEFVAKADPRANREILLDPLVEVFRKRDDFIPLPVVEKLLCLFSGKSEVFEICHSPQEGIRTPIQRV